MNIIKNIEKSLILKYLLRSSIEDLKLIIENFDFEIAQENAHKFIKDGGIQNIKDVLIKSEKVCPSPVEYTVYLLIGFGNVDGTSLPASHPFIYFGIENYNNLDQLTYLVPHEYNHMVRINTLEEEYKKLSVKTLIVAEGLATLFPLIVLGKKIRPYSIVDAKMMSEEAVEYCFENERGLVRELEEICDEPINSDKMSKYFISDSGWKENGEPQKIGYYIGSRIIGTLLNKDFSICELTTMETEGIIDRWKKASVR